MSEERNDRTIGEMTTLGPDGPLPKEEVREAEGKDWEWDPSQTIGELPTVGPKEEGLELLAGRYRVVRRLGEGGMGSVWLAEDTKLDGRKVAVKMLPAVLAGKKGAYRRVKQEALVAMKLSHPNIATVRAFEEDEGGNPFLVMDYIEGDGLDEILEEKGELSEAETVKLLGPVAAALDYAHSQGVVHRDVKPGNVMVRKDGTPFVLDFGIAREIQETMTRVTGKFSSGTLLYMSPEQLHGRAPKATQDVYSFAAMAYECLKGEPPFARGQIEYQIDHDDPEPLEAGVVSKTLREGILAGLAKNPTERPGSCVGVLVAGECGEEERPTAGLLPNTDAATTGRGDGKVFLLKVRVGKALEEAQRGDATVGEKAELERVREVFAAGEEALKAGRDGAAKGLFVQAEETIDAWRKEVVTRRQREREDAERKKKEAEERKRREKETEKERERIQREIVAEARVRNGQAGKIGEVQSISLPGGDRMEMVWCPAGIFTMGCTDGDNDEKPLHEVTLTKGFWMAKTEVTQKQWQSVMGTNPAYFQKGDNYPVECVSWEDAREFCRKTGLDLPTEAEWEYACRAGTTENRAEDFEEMGWYGEGGDGSTHPVGLKQPNAWGLQDMYGNVWEWCGDWYGKYLDRAVTNPMGSPSGENRVIRGGCYWDDLPYCRATSRDWNNPSSRDKFLGFRPVSREK